MVRSASRQGPVQVVVNPVVFTRDWWRRSDFDVGIGQGDPVLVAPIQCEMSATVLSTGRGDDLWVPTAQLESGGYIAMVCRSPCWRDGWSGS